MLNIDAAYCLGNTSPSSLKFHPPEEMKNQHPSRFGFLVASIVALIALWPVLDGHDPRWPWLAAAGLVSLIAAGAPGLLAPFAGAWFALGHLLGIINTRLLLGVVFFLVITPTGLLARLVGHDPLRLRRPGPSGYWQSRAAEWQPESFKNQF